MHTRVTAKNVGDPFFMRHSVDFTFGVTSIGYGCNISYPRQDEHIALNWAGV